MNPGRLRELLDAVRAGAIEPGRAAELLRAAPTTDLGFAQLDHDRERRCGFPEVVLCEGKTAAQVAAIAVELHARHGRVLLTRVVDAQVRAVVAVLSEAEHHPAARCVTVGSPAGEDGLVAVLAAGTADLGVAEEARITAKMLGARVETHYDVGVAGLHRLLARLPRIREARALVVVAGMEGALPSVVAGLVDRPIVAVPTSTGYGVGQGGLAALATMLSSCAAGVTVVNIDNGFGAGYAAALINRQPVVPRG